MAPPGVMLGLFYVDFKEILVYMKVHPSYRQKPVSSPFYELENVWTPVFAGVTTRCESIEVERKRK
jgi:hypothetical protein